MDKKYYNMSFSQLVLLYLPPMLHFDAVIALASALIYPLTQIYRSFSLLVSKTDTSVNSQVCYMQSALNNRYDYYERRIIVRDSPINYNDFFLFDEGKGDATMTYDNQKGDAVLWVDNNLLGSTNTDFEIVFPLGYLLSDNEFRALKQFIDNNKLASKRFKIVYETR